MSKQTEPTKAPEADIEQVTKALDEKVSKATGPLIEENSNLKKQVAQLEKDFKELKSRIEVTHVALPEGLKMYKPVKSFTGTDHEKKVTAYKWATWFLSDVMRNAAYTEKAKELGLHKAHSEGVNTAGGVLVPDDLQNSIVDLREQYGVFRRSVRVRPMSRDTQEFPRRTGGLTASFKGEAEALAESTKSWDSVTLTARKLTALAKFSSELNEDAMISIGDDLASEIAYAFENKVDECGFNGTGGSDYGGMYGILPRIKAIVGATTTSAGGVVVAAGNLMSEVTLANFHEMIGVLPQYADTGNVKWYCHRYFFSNVMERLARAAGGVTAMEIRGAMQKSFIGYPVEISQVFPKTDTNSQILCLLGDLTLSSSFGDRRDLRISVSDQVYWANDQFGIKGTSRFDINNHDLGTSTVAGPVVALQALNS
jgi:HK97 family phage major capsid protein